MPEPSDLIRVERDGTLRVKGADYDRRLRQRIGDYALAIDLPGVIMLRGVAHESGVKHVPLMAGEIVSRMTVMEILGILAQLHWRGDLHVIAASVHRVLSFDQGALKFATSDSIAERLGEVMVQSGALKRPDFEVLLAAKRPDQRFGEACVEAGLLDQKKLFDQIRRQAESIFFGALLVGDGYYAFVAPDDHATEQRPWTVHLAIQGLLMEGVQRIDEMALFRAKIPHSGVRVVRLGDASDKKIDDNGKLVLAAVDGVSTIDDIAKTTGLGEFLTTKALYHLLQAKLVALRSAPNVDSTDVRDLVSRFNDVLRDVFAAVETHGGLVQARATLGAWIVGSGYEPYFGTGVDEHGTIDAAHVASALARTSGDQPLEELHQALHELAAFALFSATTSLPRDRELALARDVNARLEAIRLEHR